MTRAAIATAALALALTGCAAPGAEPATTTAVSQEQLLSAHGLATMDARDMIDHLDQQQVTDRPTDLMASVYTDKLVLSDADQEVVLDLPQDLTYVSIAPYVTRTHDCFYHSLTTCGAVPCLVDTLTLAQNGPENARNHHAEKHLHR